MYTQSELDDYMAEIRKHLCAHCIERPPGGPPCAPLGKRCGVELHLPSIIDIAHGSRCRAMDPYIERFHCDVCEHCAFLDSTQCPCPLDPLLQLAIEAIETVDERRAEMIAGATAGLSGSGLLARTEF